MYRVKLTYFGKENAFGSIKSGANVIQHQPKLVLG